MRVNATTSLSRMEVVADTDGLTSRAGSALLSGLADALGLTDGLVRGLARHHRAVRHEPGRVVRDLAVMLADGGDALRDLGVLRDQPTLFGPVASDATAYRCLEALARLPKMMGTRTARNGGSSRRNVRREAEGSCYYAEPERRPMRTARSPRTGVARAAQARSGWPAEPVW